MVFTSHPMTLRIVSKPFTNQGMKRGNNEDWVAGFEPTDPQEIEISGNLYIVADGVGGASKGERASQYAAQKVLYEYFKHPEASPEERLAVLIRKAGNDIYQHALETGAPRMATTMVAAVVLGDRLIVANVGDSRAYLIRNGTAIQISQDHNLASELVRNGTMTPEEAKHSKTHNKLLRSLGGEPDVDVDIFPPIQLIPGDLILLCTDGLTRYAEAEEIVRLSTPGSVEQIGEAMTDFANQAGGADNITLYVIKVHGDAEETRKIHHSHAPEPVDWDMVQTQAEAPTIRVRRPPRFTQKQKIILGGLIGILAAIITVGSIFINSIGKVAPNPTLSPSASISESPQSMTLSISITPETTELTTTPQTVQDVGILGTSTPTQSPTAELISKCVHQIQTDETIYSIYDKIIFISGPNMLDISQLNSQYTNCVIKELQCYGLAEEINDPDLIQTGNYLLIPINDATVCESIENSYWVTVP